MFAVKFFNFFIRNLLKYFLKARKKRNRTVVLRILFNDFEQ